MKHQKCGNALVPEPIITGTLRVTDPPRGRAKDHCIVDDAGFNDPDATPETDKYYGVSPCGPGEVGTDDVEFARKLELGRNSWKRETNIADEKLKAARAELRSARHVLGIEYGIEQRTVAESIGLLKHDWQSEKHYCTKLICDFMDLNTELDALKTAENRRAIGLDMPVSANAEIMQLHRAFDDLKRRYESLRNPAGATIADGGEWSREEAIEMHRRKAEELLKVTIERDRLLKANADVVAHQRALLDQVTALRAERDNLWQHRDAMQGALKTLAAERDQLRASNQELKEILVLLTRAIHDENWKEIANLVPRMEAAFAAPEAALTKGNRP